MAGAFTPFGALVDPARPLTDYPRPQLVRGSYHCLNGPWQYAITRSDAPPKAWDGIITVPFVPESLLSGVGRAVQPEDFLWYRRRFTLPEGFVTGRVRLHFGGVDQCCTVKLNGAEVGRHDGGYLPFWLDITKALLPGENELCLMVIDETERAPYMRGAQSTTPGPGSHSAMSGIWQTVWIESVPEGGVDDVHIRPLYDEQAVEITVEGEGCEGTVEVFALSTMVRSAGFTAGKPVRLELPGALSWRPDNPFLYRVRITAGEDCVASYFGMRKFHIEQHEGAPRLFLNNKPFFARGVIDQGIWPDGLYTPPSDDAMEQDIRFAKRCGFNMIRKSGKLEPLRWYFHCDVVGMVIWQDIPGGGGPEKPTMWQKLRPGAPRRDKHYRSFGRENAEGRATFLRDADAMLHLLKSVPCLGGWVLFNEGYGQFDSAALASHFKAEDPARMVVAASGRWDSDAGDIESLHQSGSLPAFRRDGRALFLGECGGFVMAEGSPESAAQSAEELNAMQEGLWRRLAALKAEGLSGFCYRQLSDAERETDGLQTARRDAKLNPNDAEARNTRL